MRNVEARTEIVDQFSVWADAINKIGGLDSGVFTVKVFHDGAVDGDTAVTLAEIPDSPGDWKASWTFGGSGFWEVEVLYAAGLQVYHMQFDVAEPVAVGGSRPPGYA